MSAANDILRSTATLEGLWRHHGGERGEAPLAPGRSLGVSCALDDPGDRDCFFSSTQSLLVLYQPKNYLSTIIQYTSLHPVNCSYVAAVSEELLAGARRYSHHRRGRIGLLQPRWYDRQLGFGNNPFALTVPLTGLGFPASLSVTLNNSSAASLKPCNAGGTCCFSDEESCNSNLLCRNRESGEFSRQYCSDRAWPEGRCSKLCSGERRPSR